MNESIGGFRSSRAVAFSNVTKLLCCFNLARAYQRSVLEQAAVSLETRRPVTASLYRVQQHPGQQRLACP
jgi:hypothetical protein